MALPSHSVAAVYCKDTTDGVVWKDVALSTWNEFQGSRLRPVRVEQLDSCKCKGWTLFLLLTGCYFYVVAALIGPGRDPGVRENLFAHPWGDSWGNGVHVLPGDGNGMKSYPPNPHWCIQFGGVLFPSRELVPRSSPPSW
jgi:hypothetical protein